LPPHDAAPVPTAAIVYDAEVLPAGSIPAESFDRKVSAALTPGGVFRLGQAP
jgi:5-formyltetrahydrofolate cyclo-ligase